MQVDITEFKKVCSAALTLRGLTLAEAEIVIEPFVLAELAGKKTHGIAKFFLIDEALRSRIGRPEIVRDRFNFVLIDARRELGYLSAQFATDVLIQKAREFGNSIVATKNSYYYSIAGIYARKVAEAGFVSIITNNGGPAAVTPFGGVDPILGTNPIAIGLPCRDGVIVLDMATSEKTWGEINLAKVEKRSLNDNTFVDDQGQVTTDPFKAKAIQPFGGVKGAGLNFVLEVLTGAFVGAKMGLQSQNGYDLGFLFFAYSPDMFTTRVEYDQSISQLVKEIKESRKQPGIGEIFLPGEQSDQKIQLAMQKGSIEIEDSIWQKLITFSQGGDVKGQEKLVE